MQPTDRPKRSFRRACGARSIRATARARVRPYGAGSIEVVPSPQRTGWRWV